MVLMVLDHARDFYMGFGVDPTDLDTTTPILFFTRWITHFCAPGFVLLAGISAFLQGRSKPAPQLRYFLITRGLWLVFLELTVVRFGWIPEPFYRFTLLQVIWVIGLSMLALAPLTFLPSRAVLALGALGILSHNLLDGIDAETLSGPQRLVWSVLHDPATFEPASGHVVRIAYSLLPWLSVMCLGYGLGELFVLDEGERRPRLAGLGLCTMLAFVVVRGLDGYGDPHPWAQAPDAGLTRNVMAFLDCEKYPPSLDYLLMTLGPIFLLLALFASPGFEARFARFARWLEVYGRVPLFFYVAHLYLLRPIGIACALGRFGWSAVDPEVHDGSPEWPLYAAYLAWLAALVVLHPACAWFGDLKRRRSGAWPWLRYL